MVSLQLVGEENGIFATEFQSLVESFFVEREFAAIFLRNRDFLMEVAAKAKAEFQETFWGVLAQSGFGWGLIRPEHVRHLTTDADTVNIDWVRTVAAVGFTDWIGSAATKNQINRDAYLAIIGIGNFDASPKSVATRWNVEGTTHPVWDYEWSVKNGLKLWSLPRPQSVSPRRSIHFRLKAIATGRDEPFLVGMTFARSNYLQQEAPDIESP
ncbi:MAG: hypothetical protein WDA27_15470 [Actinomycetota bacterium]